MLPTFIRPASPVVKRISASNLKVGHHIPGVGTVEEVSRPLRVGTVYVTISGCEFGMHPMHPINVESVETL